MGKHIKEWEVVGNPWVALVVGIGVPCLVLAILLVVGAIVS